MEEFEDYISPAEMEEFNKKNNLGCKGSVYVFIGVAIFFLVLFIIFFIQDKLGF